MKKTFFIFVTLIGMFSCNSLVEREEASHVLIDTVTISRAVYELKYLSNWKIDTADKDFDIDSYFSIDAPVEDGTSMFFLFNTPINEEEQISAQVKAHLEKAMKNGIVSYFDHWGNFRGHGALLKGKIMGIWKGEVTIFCHSGDSTSFLAVCQYLDNDTLKVLPGFRLIESSFKLRQ
jgi:hypothetical protein